MKRFFFVCMALVMAGCAAKDLGGNVYMREHVRSAQTVKTGTIASVKPVHIQGTRSGIGAISGAALGAVLGSAVGSGTGRSIAQVGGAVAGTYAGSRVEEGMTAHNGWELIVDLDNGTSVAIVQSATEKWSQGERIRVLEADDGTVRVTKM